MRTLLLSLAVVGLALTRPADADAPPGWKFHAGDKGKPAVLLIHGLAASRTHWTAPAKTWSIKDGHYKHWKAPKKQSGKSNLPVIKGMVRSIVLSPVDKRAYEEGSFWNYLVEQGFTVATWNQIPCMDTDKLPTNKCQNSDTFDVAYTSSRAALAYFASQTGEDIALVAHSRGGLIGRKLLKEKDADLAAIKRVKWFVTLHTPHHGSSMASKGNALQKALKNPTSAIELSWVPDAVRDVVKKLLPAIGEKLSGSIDVLVLVAGLRGAKELDGKGAVIKGIEDKETKRADGKYYTFGGTSPRIARAYARVYSDGGTEWKTEPRQILDFPAGLDVPFDEMKKDGDLLVTDASSHFAFEDKHFTNKLNHAEVLWNRGVQKQVASLLVADPKVVDAPEIESGADDGDDAADDGDEVAAPAPPDPAPAAPATK